MATFNEVLYEEKLLWEAVAKNLAMHLAKTTGEQVLLTIPNGSEAAKSLIAVTDEHVSIVLGADGMQLKAIP